MIATEVTLDALVGLHSLDAVDEGSQEAERYGSKEECNTISFRLDGVVYTAIEDADDGYRSSMDKLIIDDRNMKNVFPTIQVMAKKKGNDRYRNNDILEFVDVVTGNVVLEVGTDNSDDYYPWFVATFSPQNMATNAKQP